jgi:hypothetical protein
VSDHDLEEGNHDSGTGAEGCVGVGGIGVFGWHLSRGDVCTGWLASEQGGRFADDLSLYVTLGIFLLRAARNPSANRSVIAFAAWSSFAHAAVMAVMAVRLANERGDLLIAGAVFSVVGAVLTVLAPAKQSGERASAAVV